MLTFNKEEHKYFLGKRELISVTTLIKSVGLINTSFYKKSGTDRGTRVHKFTELYDKGELDWSTVDEEAMPYVEAWVRFSADRPLRYTGIEEIGYHPLFNYAGMMDRITNDYVIDIKTGKPERWHSIQLTLYGMIKFHNDGIHRNLACV